MLGWLVVILLALVGVFYALTGETSPVSDLGGTERWLLIAGLVLSSFFVIALFSDYAGRLRQAAGHFGIWVGIFLALILGYSFREEVSIAANRLAVELSLPGTATTVTSEDGAGSAVRIRKRLDGHFVARSQVNGTSISMLVDTGATTVVLKPADAERAGVDTGKLTYSVPVRTANGTAFAAPIRLQVIAIGPIKVRDVEALVAKPGSLNESLLGMSFLRRLVSYEFSGDFLTLRS